MDLRGAGPWWRRVQLVYDIHTYKRIILYPDTRTHINIEYFNSNRRDERGYYFINVRAPPLPANTRHYGRQCL